MSQVLELRTRDHRVLTQPTDPYLVFTNPGTLEIELVKLLGVSVKESDDAIGFFGTGLKYALAATMRLGGSMTIITGGRAYEVGGQTIRLRDKEFTQVTLDGEALGFTTELGKQWEPWMVVRELYSNALDENGATFISSARPSSLADDDRTVITLHGQCFVDVWNERDKHFLDLEHERPFVQSKYAAAYSTDQRNRSIFYRGIRIHDTATPTLYKYNLRNTVTLTEDRTLRYVFQMDEAIEKTIITSTDRGYIYRSLTCGIAFHEGHLTFMDGHPEIEMSDEFKAACADLLERMPENVNKGALNFYKRRTQTQISMTPVQLSHVQQTQLDRAVAFVNRIGFDDLDRFPMMIVRSLGENVYGRALDGRIYIGRDCFDKGTKFLASTIVEEYVHCRYGFSDESRSLQTWLFDRVISMGEEHVTGEPL